MELSLQYKHALVCGSSQGIGRAIALKLAECGASVTLMARSEAALLTVQAELNDISESSASHDFIVADFKQPDQVKEQIARYLSRGKTFEILVNNSGGPPPGPLTEANTSTIEEAFSAHLICNHHLAQALFPGMKEKGYGRIINIISTSVKQPLPGLGVSNTVRGAVASWAKTMSNELGAFGITVNNILPGATETGRLTAIIDKKSAASGKSVDEVRSQMVSQIPLGRFAKPEEIANAACFLASPLAAYITGTSLPVDGGRTSAL